MRTCDYSPNAETKQNCHVLKTKIVAGAFQPDAEDTEYNIESYSVLKIFATLHNPLLPHITLMCFLCLSPDSSKVKKK